MSTDLSGLNPQQREAVLQSVDHNVVLLAGAGAGKTSTMVKRTEYLITDMNVNPENIMLVTFTNKAANEIKERINKISEDAGSMWIGTFHKICIRLLHKFGWHLNISKFTIIDTNDAKKIIKKYMDQIGEETTKENIKFFQSKISKFKNNLVNKESVRQDPTISYNFAYVYENYMDHCWREKTFDFDDLIIYAILLLSSFKDVSNWVHENIKYIMIDECQDTNMAQFVLINLLRGDNNTMLVGDVNQSIYAFRNAKPEYLENFADTTDNTLKLKLEQNYRSTGNIINAANNVVSNNKFGTKLEMFCDNGDGDKIQIFAPRDTSYLEAERVAYEIMANAQFLEKPYSDNAIIYRANYQSRIIEEIFIKKGIPYVIFGSNSFFTRKEVRDLLAFCKIVINPLDVNSFSRILLTLPNVGKKKVEFIIEYATQNKISLKESLLYYIDNKVRKGKEDLEMIYDLLDKNYSKCSEIIHQVFGYTRYRSSVAIINSDEASDSVQIMDEFQTMIESIEEKNPEITIQEVIDDISLLSDAKGEEKSSANAVKLMTAHASKGLEFDSVFIIGVEEGLFPHANAIETRTDEAIEEERRLFYVAMTRAKRHLYLSRSKSKRTGLAGYEESKKSRFIDEIPEQYKETVL